MRLWDYDEFGEPWLENGKRGNPPLMIVNPIRRKKVHKVHKKGKKNMARRKHTRRRVRVSNPRPRRHYRRHRRNPWPMAGPVAMMNPRRRHRRSRMRHNPRRRRHGYRRNPAIMGISLPPLQSVVYAGVGFVGTPMVEGFLSKFLPLSVTTTTIGKYATRIGSVLGLSFVTRMVLGTPAAKMVAIGGGAYVLATAVNEFAPGMLPAGTLSAYRPATLGAYATPTVRQLSAPNFGAQNTVRSAAFGGANIVSTRFRRFQ